MWRCRTLKIWREPYRDTLTLGLGCPGRVPAKTQHWACRTWNRAAQGLFRAQMTCLNRWFQVAMSHTQDLAGTLKTLGLRVSR